MNETPADLTPVRLLEHIRNLQRQINTLAVICLELKSSLRRCGECQELKSINDCFHKNSWVCKPCKSKLDREIYEARKL